MTLTVGSLFSGIGGLDLGLERAGMEVIWQSEIDPYCNKVLKKHWPEVINHGNIKDINWGTVQRPDIVCGGYPCQPFSTAGKRKGTDDPRHLWPWVRDAISALQPKYAILENVRGHLSMGGLQVIGELAQIGYDAEWRVVSAAGMGAPHRRDRIIIVAHPSELLCNGSDNNARISVGSKAISELKDSGGSARMANSNSQGSQGSCRVQESKTQLGGLDLFGTNKGRSSIDGVSNDVSEWDGEYRLPRNTPTQGGIWRNNGRRKEAYDGWQWWESEPDVGRVAYGISNRVDRLRGLGNAVVPQVAEYIGRLVMAAHNNA